MGAASHAGGRRSAQPGESCLRRAMIRARDRNVRQGWIFQAFIVLGSSCCARDPSRSEAEARHVIGNANQPGLRSAPAVSGAGGLQWQRQLSCCSVGLPTGLPRNCLRGAGDCKPCAARPHTPHMIASPARPCAPGSEVRPMSPPGAARGGLAAPEPVLKFRRRQAVRSFGSFVRPVCGSPAR